ncbi:hypothetical protein H6503_00025 [Candidatus Woesearchaeota archaeon]|nr:hypothetical protein [Candidatus Woesearchaeota archaeon]
MNNPTRKRAVINLSLDDVLNLKPGDKLQFNPNLTDEFTASIVETSNPYRSLEYFGIYEFEDKIPCHTHGLLDPLDLPDGCNDYSIKLKGVSEPIHYSWLADIRQLPKNP